VPATATTRDEATELVATKLVSRASRLTRLLLRAGDRELSRTEAGLLMTLLDGPRRVSELAESEALAQPTVTQVVERLQQRELVAKARSAEDGRVVLVRITATGRRRLARTQEAYRGLLREAMAALPDDELAGLAAATETLERLIEELQHP
jgi:DNA-binding MarR family transcriptional regulator